MCWLKKNYVLRLGEKARYEDLGGAVIFKEGYKIRYDAREIVKRQFFDSEAPAVT